MSVVTTRAAIDTIADVLAKVLALPFRWRAMREACRS